MRIVIAGPPKAGNVWLKCILANIYDLEKLGPKQTAERPNLACFAEWVGAGRFPDGSVFHQHFTYSPELADAIAAVPAHVVTIIRDPYDAFVSSYYTLQQHADADESNPRIGRPSDLLLGKPLDHPDVLGYLARGGFRGYLIKGVGWVKGNRGPILRYEDLHRDPIGTLTRVTDQIATADPDRIAAAVDACSAENMRKNTRTANHVRTATVGDSKQRLSEAHLAIFREHHADLIGGLGYPVR